MLTRKDYLGDGVYVDFENGMLKLTTEDGYNTNNVIYLEPEVYAALVRYVAMLKAAQGEKEDNLA